MNDQRNTDRFRMVFFEPSCMRSDPHIPICSTRGVDLVPTAHFLLHTGLAHE